MSRAQVTFGHACGSAAGETQASWTSAVAVAAATHGEGDVTVHFPGGDLRVRLAGGRAWLTGPPATRPWTKTHRFGTPRSQPRTPGGLRSPFRVFLFLPGVGGG